MKKKIRNMFVAMTLIIFGLSFSVSAVSADSAHTQDDWTLTRATISYTDNGIEINQTEMGTPDNHAIAILTVPFTDLNSFEIKFHVTMNDYVATGRQANDVWTAVNIMGVPSFFNWRNSATYGYAKDTPGLVTRFLSYDGDLRLITDVYQENYHTSEDGEIVDTWTCVKESAGVSVDSDITLKFVWEASSKDSSKSFYGMYVNGKKISTSDQLAFVDRSILFPENKIYLTVVMNTQQKDGNSLSKVVIKEINGVSYVKQAKDDADGGSDKNSGKSCASCGGSIESAFAMLSFALLGSIIFVTKKKEG